MQSFIISADILSLSATLITSSAQPGYTVVDDGLVFKSTRISPDDVFSVIGNRLDFRAYTTSSNYSALQPKFLLHGDVLVDQSNTPASITSSAVSSTTQLFSANTHSFNNTSLTATSSKFASLNSTGFTLELFFRISQANTFAVLFRYNNLEIILQDNRITLRYLSLFADLKKPDTAATLTESYVDRSLFQDSYVSSSITLNEWHHIVIHVGYRKLNDTYTAGGYTVIGKDIYVAECFLDAQLQWMCLTLPEGIIYNNASNLVIADGYVGLMSEVRISNDVLYDNPYHINNPVIQYKPVLSVPVTIYPNPPLVVDGVFAINKDDIAVDDRYEYIQGVGYTTRLLSADMSVEANLDLAIYDNTLNAQLNLHTGIEFAAVYGDVFHRCFYGYTCEVSHNTLYSIFSAASTAHQSNYAILTYDTHYAAHSTDYESEHQYEHTVGYADCVYVNTAHTVGYSNQQYASASHAASYSDRIYVYQLNSTEYEYNIYTKHLHSLSYSDKSYVASSNETTYADKLYVNTLNTVGYSDKLYVNTLHSLSYSDQQYVNTSNTINYSDQQYVLINHSSTYSDQVVVYTYNSSLYLHVDTLKSIHQEYYSDRIYAAFQHSDSYSNDSYKFILHSLSYSDSSYHAIIDQQYYADREDIILINSDSYADCVELYSVNSIIYANTQLISVDHINVYADCIELDTSNIDYYSDCAVVKLINSDNYSDCIELSVISTTSYCDSSIFLFINSNVYSDTSVVELVSSDSYGDGIAVSLEHTDSYSDNADIRFVSSDSYSNSVIAAASHIDGYSDRITMRLVNTDMYSDCVSVASQSSVVYSNSLLLSCLSTQTYYSTFNSYCQHISVYADCAYISKQFIEYYKVDGDKTYLHRDSYADCTVVDTHHSDSYQNNALITQINSDQYSDCVILSSISSYAYAYGVSTEVHHHEYYQSTTLYRKLDIDEYSSVDDTAYTQSVSYLSTITVSCAYSDHYDIGENLIRFINQSMYALIDHDVQVMTVAPYVSINNHIIDISSLDISHDEGSPYYECSLTLSNPLDYRYFVRDTFFTVTLFDKNYVFVVDERSYSRSANEQTIDFTASITGLSPLCMYDQPRSVMLTKTWEEYRTASSIVEELLGEVTWGIVDWVVPWYRVSANNSSPLSVARQLVEAAGGVIESQPNGMINVRHLYPTPVNEYQIVPAHHLLGSHHIYSMNEGSGNNVLVDRVRIRDLDGSEQDQFEFELDEGSSYTGVLKAYLSPWRENINIYTTRGPVVVLGARIDKTEELEEIIEFTEGRGSSKRPIMNLISASWLSDDLGGFVYNDYDTQITAANGGYSLLSIKYVARYFEVRVSVHENNTSAQFILETV